MVFQSYALFPHLTVAENIVFCLSVRGIPKADRRQLPTERRLLQHPPLVTRLPLAAYRQ